MFGNLLRRKKVQRDSILREICDRSTTATLQRLSADASNMSAAELRGYVRALALPTVWEEAAEVAAEHELSPSQLNRLIAPAVEQTAHIVVLQFMSQPVVSLPAPHIGPRIAA